MPVVTEWIPISAEKPLYKMDHDRRCLAHVADYNNQFLLRDLLQLLRETGIIRHSECLADPVWRL